MYTMVSVGEFYRILSDFCFAFSYFVFSKFSNSAIIVFICIQKSYVNIFSLFKIQVLLKYSESRDESPPQDSPKCIKKYRF